MNFTIYAPSRDRPQLLIKNWGSFFEKAKYPALIEGIIVLDDDDTNTAPIEQWVKDIPWNIRLVKVPRSRYMHRDYWNVAAGLGSGKLLFGLVDENEMVTHHWDEIILTKVETFLADKQDRICYIMIDDSDPTNPEGNCSFPLITREAYTAAGNCVMPDEIGCWCADSETMIIYKSLCKPRIMNLRNDVKVLHHCYHLGTRERDHLSDRMYQLLKNDIIFESQKYIDRLNATINSKS